MIRQLAFASLLLVTALAVNVQAAECDAGDESEACLGGGYCDTEENPEAVCPQADGPEGTGYVCEDEVCAYGEEDCIWCSGPIDDGQAAPTAENAKESKGIPALSILGLIAVLGAVLMARK